MAKNTVNKYVWLVETIYKAKKISFEEINRRWMDNDMSEGGALSIRTFHKWRIAIEEMFGLIIENEQGGQYRYFIQNADELRNGSMRSWLFNTLSVSNLMMDSVSIKDKVLFEEIPDGEQYLPDVLEALKKNLVLGMTYQSYTRDEANTFEVEPYCLKAFKQRWYEDCFGIIADQSIDVETVKIKVSAGQANYLRSLTLHQTQREIERNDEYSIFTVRLRPTFDFRQEILSQGCDIEVLEPKWFRDEVAEIAKNMWNKYYEIK